ncbi:MAG: PAS domain-containing protein [Desulfobulbaceae bacterium]
MKTKTIRLRTILILQISGLTLLQALTFTGDILHGIHSARTMAIINARTRATETLNYRELLLTNGSVYFPVSATIPPDPSLLHRADRDITTPSGHRYTILTPRRLFFLALQKTAGQSGSVRSEIKAFYPRSSEETPDDWETQALQRLKLGQKEVAEVEFRNGAAFLRYLHPVRATEECVKNRPQQGLAVGDIFGGLSITLPMAPFEEVRRQHNIIALLLHGLLWGMGMGGILWTFRLISRREESTREAKEELQSVFDATREIITIQDRDMRIIRANKTALEAFGATPHELEGKYCYQVFRGADTPCAGCPELESIKNGVFHSAEIRHANLHKIFAVSTVPIHGENGEVTSVAHYAKDVTASRKLEDQLRQAQKMEAIGTLAGGIAHDFNNILTAVLGYAELAKEDLPADSSTVADIEEVIHAGLRARELVRQILTFSRQAEESIQSVLVQSITKEVLKLLRSTIPASIEFRQNIDPECEPVLADPTQIHQVLMNLCTNAYHAMRDKGGILEVALTRTEFAATDVADRLEWNRAPTCA